ncbi:hypothetical protein MLD38_037124 [Melastoma candidum]|uniref:Uncharacterized protein n=1 Tax=Melastoma candidum TaxID=119954 RepID=A0ACB9LMC2_9MYRT|nr:hypothetical protein MLD38_037124 [Melastoma candidum]
MVGPFSELVDDLNRREGVPPITCILSDGFMNFVAFPAAEKVGVPLVHLFTISACALLALKHHRSFLERCRATSTDDVSHSERIIDWIPGMKSMRERDMPNFLGSIDCDDPFVKFTLDVLDRTDKADATIINTFEELEQVVLTDVASLIRNIYAIGPVHLILDRIPRDEFISKHIHGNLWAEHTECLDWLDTKEPGSVLYVNFGSIAFLTHEQLTELAAGLANSDHSFLWVLRPDLVHGETVILPPGFVDETKERGFLSGWCPQEKVLNHSSIGGFLTHCGWNSILESLAAGVPMICWPKFADQQPNARYVCEEWNAGLEFGFDVNRDTVERVVKELLGSDKGKELKRSAVEWKRLAAEGSSLAGSSQNNMDKLIKDVMLRR